ncbi:LEM domain-containing protein Bocksbeutel-like [Drosophila tropicalis]|uniref:LEM domain-containing protein Bocksbeutel-like n=1 Tax=Drosophila tropicalis TaxID=46794 RepID=UPI0035AB8366
MSELDKLSNKELLAKCREHGLPVVPITDTTRNVIIRRLQSAISGSPLNNSKKNTKSSKTVVAKNVKPSRKTIEAVKVTHGKSTTKNTVNLERRTVTKGKALDEAPNEDDNEDIEEPRPQSKMGRGRKESHIRTNQPPNLKRRTLPATCSSTKTVSESGSQASDGPAKLTPKRLNLGNKLNEREVLPLTKTSVSVTAYIHEEQTSSEEDTATLKRKTACGRKEAGQNTDLKRRTLHTKGRSVQFAPSVSDAGCQADMPSSERETIFRKEESYTLNTRKPTTFVPNLGSQTDKSDYLKPQKSLSSQDDARARRSKLLTRTEVVTTSYIHQVETSEEDKETSSCKRRRICTSPVSCPPPIYESGFGSTFASNLNAVKPSDTQTLTTSPTALYAPRSTLSGSARSLREESTFSVRKCQVNDNNSWPTRSEGSIQPTATGSSLYPKLDHFYKQQSFSNSFRGEPMDTDSDLDITNHQKTYWRSK